MDRMGDVMKKNDDADRQFEAKIMREQLAREKTEEARDKREKEARKQREINLISELGDQVIRKRKQREDEQKDNAFYIKMVID
jgi:hypothetical protein